MNYRTGGPRSFNTVKRSNREERLKRRRQCDRTLVSIFVVFLLLVLSAFILLVCNVAVGIHDRNQTTEQSGETQPDAPNLPASYVESDRAYHYQDGELVVVNRDYSYMINGELIVPNDLAKLQTDPDGAYLVSNHKTQYLREFVIDPLKSFLKDFYDQTNVRLTIKDTYRDKDQQKLQGSSGVGYSEHHTGLVFAFDAVNQSELAKLTSMCHQYGFIQRYPTSESAETYVNDYEECFRYVGVAHATYIYNYNKSESDGEKLCWEEYVRELKEDHSFEKEHLTVDTNGDNVADYEIYYVKINDESGSAKIPVPVGMSYTVSGDNIGGVIVTVALNS